MKTVYGKIIVISDDVYLTQGLIRLFEKAYPLHPMNSVIFLDVDRIKTVSRILSILQSLDSSTVVAGIGRNGVISKYFSPLAFANIDDSLQTLAEKIRRRHPSSFTTECWISRCQFALKPPFLTQTQMRIFTGIQKGFSVPLLAKLHAIDLKTCYSHSNAIVKKLHLKNTTELRLLLANI